MGIHLLYGHIIFLERKTKVMAVALVTLAPSGGSFLAEYQDDKVKKHFSVL